MALNAPLKVCTIQPPRLISNFFEWNIVFCVFLESHPEIAAGYVRYRFMHIRDRVHELYKIPLNVINNELPEW